MATASKQSNLAIERDKKQTLLYVEKEGVFGGYKLHLLKEDLPSYLKGLVTCSTCEGVLREACGVGDTQVCVCLSCAQEKNFIVLKPIREAVANLVISCPLKSRGCNWEGKTSGSETHLDVCESFRLDCQLSCGTVVERSGMKVHVSKQCPHREIMCEYCLLSHKEKETNIHQEKCKEFPLQCPNKCGSVVKRQHMVHHVVQECENTLLECPYKEYGCETRVVMKEMVEHKKENRLVHLELKTDSLCGKLKIFQEEKQKEKLIFQKEKQIFQEENILLKREVSMLKKFMSSYEGKCIFRINNLKEISNKPTLISNFLINNPNDLGQRNAQIYIFCFYSDENTEPSVETRELNICAQALFYNSEFKRNPIFRLIGPPRLCLNGCVALFNQSDYSIHCKYEYSAELDILEKLNYKFNANTVLAKIPYEQIQHPNVCVNNGILVHFYYNHFPM